MRHGGVLCRPLVPIHPLPGPLAHQPRNVLKTLPGTDRGTPGDQNAEGEYCNATCPYSSHRRSTPSDGAPAVPIRARGGTGTIMYISTLQIIHVGKFTLEAYYDMNDVYGVDVHNGSGFATGS